MIRAALPAVLLTLSACGGEPDTPPAPVADEAQVLSEAAEMLPDEAPSPSESASEAPAD